ncbi:hypothetical protein [Leifsonia sp. Root112D2]|uniref:hypothetical protein n=1 Tax=Leifsonia sp. Root112D2 TaxID=1736426 RepID=UPI0006FB92E0|nr:hypothetical protein [Leifsonia sp. Root112D2]KQV05067.1 hypothetical protein ASC63_14785 [Leifsonia sp. Root112D2]
MFVITADQIDSRSRADIVGTTLHRLNREHDGHLALPVDRNAGDELQVMTTEASTTLAIVLDLTRSAQWSVGIGCGAVRLPLPAATREGSGPAFFAARDAVTRAKKQATRFAVETAVADDRAAKSETTPEWPGAADAEGLLNLLLLLRGRRSDAGWELYDLVVTGMQQNEAAERIGISAPAANSRARAAGLKTEFASIGPLTRLLENLDRVATGMDENR